jgi:periplasmic protein TonB
METKKNANADLRKKSGLFMNIGLVISLLFVLLSFEYKSYDEGNPIPLDYGNTDFPEPIVIPPTRIKPPPPKEITLIEVKDDIPIIEELPHINNEFNDSTSFTLQEIEEPAPEITKDSFAIVEQMPTYPGGTNALYKFISKKIKYPTKARRLGVEGKVFLNFTVDKDGSVTNIQVIRGIGSGCDEESIRILKKIPKWNPGKQRGRAVKVQMTLPITFKLN